VTAAAGLLTLLTTAAWGVPPHPRLWESSQAGREMHAKNAPDPIRGNPMLQPDGVEYVLVLRVDFPEPEPEPGEGRAKLSRWRGQRPKAQLDRWLFAPDSASLSSYYAEASYGAMDVQPGPVGGSLPKEDRWYRMPDVMNVYGKGATTNVAGMRKLVRDACNAANSDVDFADYDRDGDGVVDHLIILHAGNDQAATNVDEDIWSVLVPDVSRSWDGVEVQAAILIGEEPDFESPHLGVWFHEFLHDFGAPESYVSGTFTGENDTKYDLMGLYGPYQGGEDRDGTQPAHISGYLKWDFDGDPENGRHGWVTPVEIDANSIDLAIPAFSNPGGLPPLFKIDLPGTGGKQFFLLENRERDVGAMFDTAIPDEGLLIWHIDESIPRSSFTVAARMWLEDPADPLHWGVQADTTDDAAYSAEDGQTAFTPSTEPSSETTGGAPTGISLLGISESGHPMTVDVFFGDTYEPNDSPSEAFVVQPGQKYDSFIFDADDAVDYYRLELTAGQRVRLTLRHAVVDDIRVALTTTDGRELTSGARAFVDDVRETVLLYESRGAEDLLVRVNSQRGQYPIAYSVDIAEEPDAPIAPPLFAGVLVYPSPVRPGGDLSIGVSFEGPGLDSVSAEMFTATGELISRVEEFDIRTGDWTFAAQATNAGGPLTPGVYIVIVTALRGDQEAKRFAKFAVE